LGVLRMPNTPPCIPNHTDPKKNKRFHPRGNQSMPVSVYVRSKKRSYDAKNIFTFDD
jgi:hypothetical protein